MKTRYAPSGVDEPLSSFTVKRSVWPSGQVSVPRCTVLSPSRWSTSNLQLKRYSFSPALNFASLPVPANVIAHHHRVIVCSHFFCGGPSCSCFSFCSIIIFSCSLVNLGNSSANCARTVQGEAPGAWTALP